MAFLENSQVSNVVTTDATPLDVAIYSVPDNTTSGFNAAIIARADDGTSAAWRLGAAVKRVDGQDAQLVGVTNTLFATHDLGAATWTATVLSVSGNNVICTVTGAAGVTIRWAFTFVGVIAP